MGGQQPVLASHSHWSEKLFSQDKISGQKTQDEKLRELQTEFREFSRKIESSISDLRETVTAKESRINDLQTEVVFLKTVCASLGTQIDDGKKGGWNVYAAKAVSIPSSGRDYQDHLPESKPGVDDSFKSVMPKYRIPAGWMNISDLTGHIATLSLKSDHRYRKEFGQKGKIGDLSLSLGLVSSTKTDHSSRILRPTAFGESSGYVQYVKTSDKGYTCVFNMEKYEKLLVACTRDPFAVIDRFRKSREEFERMNGKVA